MTVQSPPADAWLRHDPSDAVAVALVCLPHSGAGASSFNRWSELFPRTVAVVRVQLPGREDVAAVPPLLRVGDAVAELLLRMRTLEAPVALYGHSMGALVAFELARALHAAGTPPLHLFVSGRRAPGRPASRAPIHRLPDDELVAALTTMDATWSAVSRSRTFLRYALRIIRADMELSEEYAYRRGTPLCCPVTAFFGTEDPAVDTADIDAWRHETDAAFAMHTFPGDHIFHQRHRVRIAALISDALGRDEHAGTDLAS